MRFILLGLILVSTLQVSICITYLRPKNDRGPSATLAGLECLEQVERIFFKNKYSQQVQNIAVFHTRNMSSPAMEIEKSYLYGLHERILHQEDDEDSFQLKVISENRAEFLSSALAFDDITLVDFYVIVTDNLEHLKSTIKSISLTTTFNAEAKFLILVNNPLQREGGKKFAWEILDNLFTKYRAINVGLLYASDAFTYDIYTGDPYGSELECGKMRILHIGKCTSGKLADIKLTRRQLRVDKVPATMKHCTFQFCARVQEPFVNKGCKSGLEIIIMDFLRQEMGFEVNTSCSDLDRGERNEDGTWGDLLGQVLSDSCDIIAGAFYPDHEVHAQFAFTDFYLQDFYTFYVKKAELAPRWMGLISIFESNTWAAFAVVLVISWIAWFILGNVSQEPHQHRLILLTFMNVFAVSLGVTANNRPNKSTLRMFFVFLALYALTITAIYTSKLITVFTHPKYDHQIDSIEELLEMNVPMGGRLENRDWFDNGEEIDEAVFERYNFTPQFRPSTESLHKISNGEITLLISRYYVGSNKFRNEVFGLSSSMFTSPLEMIVERGFPLLRRINQIMALLRDMGFFSKIIADFQYNMTILTSMRERKANKKVVLSLENEPENIWDNDLKESDENPEIVLTIEHLEGAFTILILGVVVSFTVFLIELMFLSKFVRKFCGKFSTIVTCKRKQGRVTFKLNKDSHK